MITKKKSSLLKTHKKAKKKINWKSVLTFKENIFLVADWYKNFYLNSRKAYELTTEQIYKFQEIAKNKIK